MHLLRGYRWLDMVQFVINGIGIGAIYALIGVSIDVIYNVTGGLCFAQGQLFMLGAFLSYVIIIYLGFPVIIGGFLAIILVGFFGGTIFQKITYWPVRERDLGEMIVSTLAGGIIIENLMRVSFGGIPRIHPYHIKGIIKIGEIIIVKQYILIIVIALALMLALFFLLTKTRLGMILRAVAQKPKVTSLLGVNNGRVIAFGFLLSSMIVATAGVIAGPIFFLSLEIGFINMIKGFCAAVVGGFGNLYGAILGGIIIGVVEILSAAYISSVYKDVYAFILLILILWLKPKGLFGEDVSEKV